jgi:hypothetical protein
MTLKELFTCISQNPDFILFYFLIIPLTALLTGILGKGEGHLSPWKYLYAFLIYLVSIPTGRRDADRRLHANTANLSIISNHLAYKTKRWLEYNSGIQNTIRTLVDDVCLHDADVFIGQNPHLRV